MKIIIVVAFCFLHWGVCFLGTGTDKKNLIGLRSYPDEVQNRVRSDSQLGKAVPKAKSTAAILLSNLLLFTVIFSALGLALKNVLNLNGYMPSCWYFLALGEGCPSAVPSTLPHFTHVAAVVHVAGVYSCFMQQPQSISAIANTNVSKIGLFIFSLSL